MSTMQLFGKHGARRTSHPDIMQPLSSMRLNTSPTGPSRKRFSKIRRSSRVTSTSPGKSIRADDGFVSEDDEVEDSVFSHHVLPTFWLLMPWKWRLVSARFAWDEVLVLCCCVRVVLAPLACFESDTSVHMNVIGVLDILVWLVLVFDIPLSFNTPFYEEVYDEETESHVLVKVSTFARASKHYTSKWLIFDILGAASLLVKAVPTVPLSGTQVLAPWTVEYAVPGNACLAVALSWLGVFNWFKVRRIRQRRQQSGADAYQASLSHGAARIKTLLLTFLMVGHYFACMYYFVGRGQLMYVSLAAGNPYTGAVWVMQPEYDIAHADFVTRYVNSLYWSMTTLVTVGYGDITPHTNVEKMFAILVIFTGALLYAAVFGSVAVLIQSMDTETNRYNEQMGEVQEFMRYLDDDLPPQLKTKVVGYAHALWDIKRGFNLDNVLAEFPPPLQVEVKMAQMSSLVEKVDLFKGCSINFIKVVVTALSHRIAIAGDDIFHMGDMGEEMYFLRKGQLEVLRKFAGGKRVAVLNPGSNFGEICLMTVSDRTAGVRAITIAEYYALHKNDFDDILERFPEMANSVKETAERRLLRDVQREVKAEEEREKANSKGKKGTALAKWSVDEGEEAESDESDDGTGLKKSPAPSKAALPSKFQAAAALAAGVKASKDGGAGGAIEHKNSLLADLRQNSLGTRASLGSVGQGTRDSLRGANSDIMHMRQQKRGSFKGDRMPLMNRALQNGSRGKLRQRSSGHISPRSTDGSDSVAQALMELEEDYLAARSEILGYDVPGPRSDEADLPRSDADVPDADRVRSSEDTVMSPDADQGEGVP